MKATSIALSHGAIQPIAPDAGTAHRILKRVRCTFTSAWSRWRAYRAMKRDKAHLMALDDRLLKDIGIDRSEITSVLRDEARERKRSAPFTTLRYI